MGSGLCSDTDAIAENGKRLAGQWFSEPVRNVIFHVDVGHFNRFFCVTFTNVVIFDIDVFPPRVHRRIARQDICALVVPKQLRRTVLGVIDAQE